MWMEASVPLNFRATFLRRATATTSLETTLKKAVSVLAEWGIPHYVCGGFAVQEHGYPRLTIDVDVIVPDPGHAMWRLRQSGLFRKNQGSGMTVTDRETKVPIDLLKGGSTVSKGGLVALPMPIKVSAVPVFLTLADLLSAKLSAGRQQDLADVVELIKANNLSKGYKVDSAVLSDYRRAWDLAKKELRKSTHLGE
jgi:hypothetical protein